MSIREYAKVLRDRWKFGLAVASLLFTATLLYVLVKPPEYTARSTLYVAAQSETSAMDAYQGGLLSEQRVQSYTQLINGPKIEGEVIRQLSLDETPDNLARRLVASSELDSVIIDVAATDRSPDRAAQISNAASDATVALVDTLEKPGRPSDPQQVSIRIVERAPVPSEPSSLPNPIVLTLGLLLSLVVAALATIARDTVDTSVKSVDRLTEAIAAPVLAEIPRDKAFATGSEDYDSSAGSAAFEAFRRLRTSLQFVSLDFPRPSIIVTSSIANEGKTCVTINLARALRMSGYKVLIIDSDLRKAQLSDRLGVESTVGVTSVLLGRVSLPQAVQTTPYGDFMVLGSGALPPNPSELLSSPKMDQLVKDAEAQYDYVLFDSPPLLPVADSTALATMVSAVLLVCSASTSRSQLLEAANRLEIAAVRPAGCVLNFVNTSRKPYANYHYLDGQDPRNSIRTPVRPHSHPAHAREQGTYNGSQSSGNEDVRTETLRSPRRSR